MPRGTRYPAGWLRPPRMQSRRRSSNGPPRPPRRWRFEQRVARHREQVRARRRGGGTAAPGQAAVPSAPPPAAKPIDEVTYEERVAHHREQIKARAAQRDPKHTQGRRPTPATLMSVPAAQSDDRRTHRRCAPPWALDRVAPSTDRKASLRVPYRRRCEGRCNYVLSRVSGGSVARLQDPRHSTGALR